jgi:tetratricopeptide (TPR) repeat protein
MATSRLNQVLEMLQSEPNDVFLNYALGMEYLALNEWSSAEFAFQKVIALNENHVPCFYQLGKLNEAQGLNEKALVYYNQGLSLARTQKNNKAINEFSEAIFMLEE